MQPESQHTNSLIRAKSPYLLQHAHNPVDWREWNEETIQLAREKNLPIFLSIGYSTCHWCHVMERESFEDEAVAQLMNENFINIKLDREERPDIDGIYMKFVQATNNGQGGWPMSVFLTPELKPFYGGTYFPPQDGYGRPGFSTLLRSIAHAWQNDQAGIHSASENATKFLQSTARIEAAGTETNWNQVFSDSYAQFRAQFDAKLGGFGDAPKFPRPVVHDFLHRLWFFTRDDEAKQMSQFTLDAMSKGGMRDHLGGGFHRYAVDAQWIVSHFEKMLYDQAQLVTSLLEMKQITGDSKYLQTALHTLDYVLNDLTHESGGFFAGEDADSLPDENSSHKEEGAFYVWTQSEIESALGEDAKLFNAFYNVQPNGNAPREGDPHGEFKGKNILFTTRPLHQVAPQFALGEIEAAKRLETARQTLLQIRNARPRPHRDDKIIVAWNGLMISAFAQAGAISGDHKYLQAGERAAQFIKTELWDEQTQTLRRHYKDGASEVAAFADDYAALTNGLLDLYEASGEIMWLQWAKQVSRALVREFWDETNGAYFNAPDDPNTLVRGKDDYDGAEPSANALACHADLRLSELCEGETSAQFRERARQTLTAFGSRLQNFPSAMPLLEAAAMRELAPPLHIVLVGEAENSDTRAMLDVIHSEFLPFKTLVHLQANNREFWNAQLPFTSAMTTIDNRATAYVCFNFACRNPVNSVEALRAELKSARGE